MLPDHHRRTPCTVPTHYNNPVFRSCGHGEWFIRIVENGVQKSESYVTEADAVACAEAIRARLGLGLYIDRRPKMSDGVHQN